MTDIFNYCMIIFTTFFVNFAEAVTYSVNTQQGIKLATQFNSSNIEDNITLDKMNIVTTNQDVLQAHSYGFLDLFLQADLIVKIVMLILLIASIWSWAIILEKSFSILLLKRQIHRFEKLILAGYSFESLLKHVQNHQEKHPLAKVLIAAINEWNTSTNQVNHMLYHNNTSTQNNSYVTDRQNKAKHIHNSNGINRNIDTPGFISNAVLGNEFAKINTGSSFSRDQQVSANQNYNNHDYMHDNRYNHANNTISTTSSHKMLNERIHQAMQVASNRSIDEIYQNLSSLAIIGSSAPFIGLFGTVWGIMSSFQSIAAMKNAMLAVVAPGIAEALMATAFGLVAAIPAVIFYNRFSSAVTDIVNKTEDFKMELSNVILRELDNA